MSSRPFSITYAPVDFVEIEDYEEQFITANTVEELYEEVWDLLGLDEPEDLKVVLASLLEYKFITIDPFYWKRGKSRLLFAHTREELQKVWEDRA